MALDEVPDAPVATAGETPRVHSRGSTTVPVRSGGTAVTACVAATFALDDG